MWKSPDPAPAELPETFSTRFVWNLDSSLGSCCCLAGSDTAAFATAGSCASEALLLLTVVAVEYEMAATLASWSV